MMVSLLAMMQGAEGGSLNLPGPFQPGFGLFFWTLFVFLLLLFLLSKTAFPWMLKAVEEREQRLIRLSSEAQAARDEAAALLEQQKLALNNARSEAQALLKEARDASERERVLALEQARQEQHDLLERTRREIEREHEKAAAELRRETIDLAIAAASKVVGQRLELGEDRRLVEEYLATIGPAR